jgi:predicted HicB family RNase H-like nuclease
MIKKSFKVGADKFITALDTQNTQNTQNTPKTGYRINLKLRPQYHEYLMEEAWKAKKSITEFINDLIEEKKNDRPSKSNS